MDLNMTHFDPLGRHSLTDVFETWCISGIRESFSASFLFFVSPLVPEIVGGQK